MTTPTIPPFLRRTLELNSIAPNNLPGWIGDFAFYFIDETNLEEVISFLGYAGGDANQVFWQKVHTLPSSEEGWEALIYVGSGMTAERAVFEKQRDRRIVELIRNRFSRPDQLVHQLFHRR